MSTEQRATTGQSRPLYDQSLISRDDCGCFWHPDLPDGDEATDMRPLLLAQGFESCVVWGDSDEAAFPEEAMEHGGDAYFKALGDWQPKGEGNGWLIAAVMDTEDGPCAWLVRPLENNAPSVTLTTGLPGDITPRLAPSNITETCKAAQPECGQVQHHDSEGLPLCAKCWTELVADSQSGDACEVKS